MNRLPTRRSCCHGRSPQRVGVPSKWSQSTILCVRGHVVQAAVALAERGWRERAAIILRWREAVARKSDRLVRHHVLGRLVAAAGAGLRSLSRDDRGDDIGHQRAADAGRSCGGPRTFASGCCNRRSRSLQARRESADLDCARSSGIEGPSYRIFRSPVRYMGRQANGRAKRSAVRASLPDTAARPSRHPISLGSSGNDVIAVST